MRSIFALALAVSAAAALPVQPAVAGGVDVGERYNFVYRFWGPRSTIRFSEYREYQHLHFGPRYHHRLQREGIDLQRRSAWVPHVEVAPQSMK